MEMVVYLINLDDRVDRLIQSEINSKRWGLVFHRVSAVPKLSLPASETSFATPEVVAAFRSHQTAFKLFLDSPAQFALILEDDFLPRKGFAVPKLEVLINIDADVLQLGYLHTSYIESVNIFLINLRTLLMRFFRLFFANTPFGSRIISSKKLLSELERIPLNLVPADFRPGAHSYIVSRRAASTLLALNTPVVLSIDELLKSLSVMRTLKFFRLMLSKVDQSDSPSSITQRNLLS